jgi:hypothetical protein
LLQGTRVAPKSTIATKLAGDISIVLLQSGAVRSLQNTRTAGSLRGGMSACPAHRTDVVISAQEIARTIIMSVDGGLRRSGIEAAIDALMTSFPQTLFS